MQNSSVYQLCNTRYFVVGAAVCVPKSRTNSVNKLKHVSVLFLSMLTLASCPMSLIISIIHTLFLVLLFNRVLNSFVRSIDSYEVGEFHVRSLPLLLLFFSVFRMSVCRWCAQISFLRNRLKFGADKKEWWNISLHTIAFKADVDNNNSIEATLTEYKQWRRAMTKKSFR